ncbi:MAG: hypothetical protein Q8P41_18350 [Pseudomonadota bacterium]|nr:hypothetical protein [Pseudomonadota bacterium]
MPETATRLPRARTLITPEWAQVLRTFYAKSFDTASEDRLVESVEAFCALSPDEQAFHQAHLAYRQVQALDDIYGCLRRIEAGLPSLDPKSLGALRHLPGIRKALVVIAKGQEEMLDLLESGGGAGGDRTEGEEEPGDNGDGDGDGGDSELADAVDADEVEEEDHGSGDDAALVPEVLPAGRDS